MYFYGTVYEMYDRCLIPDTGILSFTLSVHFYGPSQGDPSSGLRLGGGGKLNQHAKLKLTSIYCLG